MKASRCARPPRARARRALDSRSSLPQEVSASDDVILFIDEIHTLIGAGAAEGAVDAANILKPALARGELQCIGATTLDEYRKHIEKDAALERRFQPVTVPEPTIEETIEILGGLQGKYEKHHCVSYSDEAIEAAVTYSSRYINDRFLPDKAIDLVDEAGALVQLENNIEMAAEGEAAGVTYPVTEETIAQVVSGWTGIPVQRLSSDESAKLLQLESQLQRRVVGQSSAVQAIARAVRRARVGLRAPNRPVASFVFAGPTGVGKTELAKTLADQYYGSEKAMVRLDMSEFMERHTVSRLIGSPPGYVGFDDGGQLTEAVRRRPHTVVLFDEIEKARRGDGTLALPPSPENMCPPF